MRKKIISFVLVFVLVGTSCGQVFATSTRISQDINQKMSYTISEDEGSFEKLPEITDEELNEAIEEAIKMEIEKVEDKEEAKRLEADIRMYLEGKDVSSQSRKGILGDLIDSIEGKLPNIKVRNKSVAATINTIINGTLIVLGVGTVSVALKNMERNN